MNSFLLTGVYCLAGGLTGLGVAALWKAPAGVDSGKPAKRQVVVSAFDAATAGTKEIRGLMDSLQAPDPASGLGRQTAWLARLGKADTDGMKEMLEEARKNPDPYERRIFRELVFVKWIQQNAEEAFAYSKIYDDGRVAGQFIGYWSRANPDQAWEYFTKQGNRQYQFQAMGHMAEEDPGRYLTMLEDPARASAMVDMDIYRAVLREGKRNTEADAEQALKTKDPDHAAKLLQGTCLLWARRDPEAAMKWARAVEDPERRQEAVFGVMREMAARDPEAAAKDMATFKGTIPESLVTEVASGLTKLGLGPMREYVDHFSKEARQSILLDVVIPVMDKPDTRTLIPLLEKYWDPKSKPDAGEPALGPLSKWVPEDASKEWTALKDFADSPAKAEMARIIAPQLARENPTAALAAAEQTKDAALRNVLGRELVNQSIQNSDEAGFLKASSLLQGQPFVKAVYDMTRELAENAPNMDKAMEFAGRQAGDTRMRSMEMVAWLWAAREPASALAWTAEGGEKMRPAFQQDLVARWAKDDSYAASTWIDSQPAGTTRDFCTSGLVSSLAASDPDAAFTWSRSISDPAMREKWSAWTVSQWAGKDPAAAWQAVEGTALDEASKAALRQALAQKTTNKGKTTP